MRDKVRSMMATRSDAFVFFGATGDLAYKQIFPALQALMSRGRLDMPVVGVAKGGGDVDRLRARAKASLESHGGLNDSAFARLCAQLRYVDGDYADPRTFENLRRALGDAKRPLHYLAIPPDMFEAVARGLAQAGCVAGARLVVEKPFGRDLASAKKLNETLRSQFPRDAIFRIDHFLGKEPVENLVYFRAANPMVEACWDRDCIESVEITMAETFGVKGRGRFYDGVGAIRDVLQNHLLEVVANLGMELPMAGGRDVQRVERTRLLGAVRTLDASNVVRGQFRGYRDEPGVAAGSRVETFAAVRLGIENDRWSGVPFCIRAGKSLPVTVTEVLVRFKRARHVGLADAPSPKRGYCRFRLGPDVVLALGMNIKRAGEAMTGERTELVAHRQPGDEMAPYERLLGDALDGDATLFAREDAVEEAWRIVDPTLGDATPLYEYDKGCWGPPEMDRIAPEGGWHDPTEGGRE
jgi:glucose-6-phosphate 1-dehydrogenase